jgi:DNA polymerase-1
MSFGGVSTGIMFGILTDILTITEEFATTNLLWFFDSREKKRSAIFEGYKAKRNDKSPAEQKVRAEAQKAISTIPKMLTDLGFGTVLTVPGFEADDLIMKAAMQLQDSECQRILVVSSDEDLYQAIGQKTICYCPRSKKYLTWDGFVLHYGIGPDRWDEVKAIAGCRSDDIPGVMKGIGEKTAIKYLMGQTIDSKFVTAIREGTATIERNAKLVRLPLEGTPELDLNFEHSITRAKWTDLLTKYGMASLVRKGCPFT